MNGKEELNRFPSSKVLHDEKLVRGEHLHPIWSIIRVNRHCWPTSFSWWVTLNWENGGSLAVVGAGLRLACNFEETKGGGRRMHI